MRQVTKFLSCLLIFMSLFYKQALAVGDIEVTAENGFVCDLKTNVCKASGNVVTSNKGSVLKSDVVEAKLAPDIGQSALGASIGRSGVGENKKTLQMLKATGNIRFQSKEGGMIARGQEAQFDVRTEELRVWGKPTIEDGKAKLFVGNYLVFYAGAKNATAVGRSTLRYEDKLLQADSIRVYFERDADQKLVFSRLEAEGQVVLSTDTEIATAGRATYRAETKVAELYNDVIISRTSGQVKGHYVRYDMITGQSQVKSLTQSTGGRSGNTRRVQVILEPQSQQTASSKTSSTVRSTDANRTEIQDAESTAITPQAETKQ